MLAINHILQQLQYHPTKQLIVASKKPIAIIQNYVKQHDCNLSEISPSTADHISLPYQAFAIIIDYLEHMEKATGLEQLARLRNLHCNHMWIAVTADNSQWHFSDFIALGCKRLGDFEIERESDQNFQPDTHQPNEHQPNKQLTVKAYGYDLGYYNRRRDWNNSRHWANPEMWSKRW